MSAPRPGCTRGRPRLPAGRVFHQGLCGVSQMKPVITLIVLFALSFISVPAIAAEGDHGKGHEKWHAEFYSKLVRPDTKTSCCNLADCRPTEIRSGGDHYEVKKDGRWIRVPPKKIVKTAAPDGGAHICAPPTASPVWGPDEVFCIVMPFET